METKTQAIQLLNEMFNKWDTTLSQMTAQEASTKSVHKNRTIKDDVAHLYVWQKISVARMEAGIENRNPDLEFLPKNFDIEAENADPVNEWIYTEYVNTAWSDVYSFWKNNYLTLLRLAEKCDEQVLMKKFSWIQGYPLLAVLNGTYDHHREHFEKLH